MLLAGRSRNRDSIPKPALQSTRPPLFFLFTQNFIEHCTLKQGLTYILCQPQCSVVNTATSVTLLYNTQTHRYNHKNTKQNPAGRERKHNKRPSSYNKTNQMRKFLKFIFGIKLYMFRTVPLSIIRSFSLYTQQTCMAYTTAVCTSEKRLMMDRGTVRNMWSFIPKINLRN